MRSTWPDVAPAVNGVSVCSTRTCTNSQLELQAPVSQHRAGQQARLEQHLEAVADADDRAAGSANACTARMIGEKRAMAPVRR